VRRFSKAHICPARCYATAPIICRNISVSADLYCSYKLQNWRQAVDTPLHRYVLQQGPLRTGWPTSRRIAVVRWARELGQRQREREREGVGLHGKSCRERVRERAEGRGRGRESLRESARAREQDRRGAVGLVGRWRRRRTSTAGVSWCKAGVKLDGGGGDQYCWCTSGVKLV
jgi:hypothetical protein